MCRKLKSIAVLRVQSRYIYIADDDKTSRGNTVINQLQTWRGAVLFEPLLRVSVQTNPVDYSYRSGSLWRKPFETCFV